MSDKENEDSLDIKLILLGESGVGKTSIINRYIEDSFSDIMASSSSMTYTTKELIINQQKIHLNIWDTVGQEKFRALSKLFFKDTKIVILVYSITSKKTFENMEYWHNLFKETIGDEIVLGVVGNKSDLFLEQEVDEELGAEYAKKHGGFFELVSAKENKNGLDKYITKLVTEYIKRNPNVIANKNLKLLDDDDSNREIKAGCCAGSKSKRVIRKYSDIIKENDGFINTVFLGEISSGKTSIINRILKKGFDMNEKHTNSLIKYNCKFNKGKMKLEIIINDVDIEQKKSTEFIDIIKKSEIFFLVFDVKDNNSLENIYFWIEVINKIKENSKSYLLYILANKNDKDDGNKNNQLIEKGHNIAEENNALIKAVSAKDNEGIIGIIDESVENYLAIP